MAPIVFRVLNPRLNLLAGNLEVVGDLKIQPIFAARAP